MLKIKEQVVDSEVICETVLSEVFGDDAIFDPDEYDTLCTIIEKTLSCVSENPKKFRLFYKKENRNNG